MATASRRRRLEVEDRGEITIVNLMDKKILDDENIRRIREDLLSLVEERKRNIIILNFQNVEYLAAAMLGGFLTLNKRCYEAGGRLVMCSINEDIYELFDITRLNRLFNIAKDEQAALAEFGSQPATPPAPSQ